MKDLLKNWITTIIGLVFLLLGAFMMLSKDYTKLEAVEMLALAMVFIKSKDSLLGIAETE